MSSEILSYFFVLIIALIAVLLAKNIARSRTGRAFQAIRESEPLPVSPERASHAEVGKRVVIGPDDYAMDTTEGELVGADAHRWIIARDTAYGTVHIHFPTEGFTLNPV